MSRSISAVLLCVGVGALGLEASGLGAVAARAADLPRRQVPPPIPLPPAFTWTGFYAGLSAGYGFGNRDKTFADPTYGSVTQSGRGGGFVGGGQVGYNYQLTPGSGFVLGAEADFQGAAFAKADAAYLGTTPYYNVGPSLDWFGTVRGRVGYAFDRVMIYGTGGFAYGGGSPSAYAASYPGAVPSGVRTGFAAGGGFEYAFTDKLSAKIEALYVNLGKHSVGGTAYDATVPAYYGTGQSDSGFAVARAGINYRF